MTLSEPEEKLLVIFKRELTSAARMLEESLERTAQLDLEKIEGIELDLIEALTARFGRTSDILIRKVWRLLMKMSEDESGTIIDIVNFAKKVGLTQSAAAIDEIRRTRKMISHDYALNNIKEVVASVRAQSPALLAAVKAASQYRVG